MGVIRFDQVGKVWSGGMAAATKARAIAEANAILLRYRFRNIMPLESQ